MTLGKQVLLMTYSYIIVYLKRKIIYSYLENFLKLRPMSKIQIKYFQDIMVQLNNCHRLMGMLSDSFLKVYRPWFTEPRAVTETGVISVKSVILWII